MNGEQLVCERDGVATKLRCALCQAGICPACLVRSPVGHRCRRCAGGREPAAARSRVGLVVAVAAGLALAGLVAAVAVLRPTGDPRPDAVAVDESTPPGPATAQPVIGDEARDGQLVFVVDDMTCTARDDRGAGKLCTLRFRARNVSTGPAILLGRFQYLVDGQSRTYGRDEALTRSLPDNANRSLSELTVNPDVTIPLTFVYEVPESVEPTEARFRGTGRSRFGISVRLQRRA